MNEEHEFINYINYTHVLIQLSINLIRFQER